MPDRAGMLTGLWSIISQPSKISTNYFAVGGYSATFLNMGLVALLCLALYVLLGAAANNVSTLAFLLTVGFTSWGINVLNMWPSILGVVLYSLVKREKLGGNVNAMLFSTGLAPLVTELMVRYPHAEAVGFRLTGVALGLAVGVAIGFFLPAGLAHSPKVHKGYDLYSAALPVGMAAFFLQAMLYKTMGVDLPAAPAAETLKVAPRLTVNTFCIAVFGILVIAALCMGCKPKDYWNLMLDKAEASSFSAAYGKAAFLMNVGVYGLFILGYYNLIGGQPQRRDLRHHLLYAGLLQFRLPPAERTAHYAGLCGSLLAVPGLFQRHRRQLLRGHQCPGHYGRPVLCQRPQPHLPEIRLGIRLLRGHDALYSGHLRPPAPRRLLPVQWRLHRGLCMPASDPHSGAFYQDQGAAPGRKIR